MSSPDREAFVAALLAGELSHDDPQVQAQLRQDPELSTMIDRIRELEAAVARSADEELAILAEAHNSTDPRLADRVTSAVQQVVVQKQRIRRLRWAAAAAVLVAGMVLGWFLLVRTPAAPGDMFLGSDEGLEPQGAVAHYSPFTWKVKLPSGGRFVVRIYGVKDGRKSTLLVGPTTERLTSPWQLPAATDAALPGEIYWELDVISPEGADTWHAHAWRH